MLQLELLEIIITYKNQFVLNIRFQTYDKQDEFEKRREKPILFPKQCKISFTTLNTKLRLLHLPPLLPKSTMSSSNHSNKGACLKSNKSGWVWLLYNLQQPNDDPSHICAHTPKLLIKIAIGTSLIIKAKNFSFPNNVESHSPNYHTKHWYCWNPMRISHSLLRRV